MGRWSQVSIYTFFIAWISITDILLETLFAVLEFASGYRLTPRVREMTDKFLELLEKNAALMNDDFSYDREAFMNRTEGVRIFDAVNFFIEHDGLPVEDAKSKVRGLIQGLERQDLREKQELFRDQPNLSHDHKCYIEHCEASIGGAHYWCAIAYRYSYWKEMPGAFKESSTVERRENPTNGTNGTCEKPTDYAMDKPMQNEVNGLVDGELHHHHKHKSDATHLNGTSRDQKKSKAAPKQQEDEGDHQATRRLRNPRAIKLHPIPAIKRSATNPH